MCWRIFWKSIQIFQCTFFFQNNLWNSQTWWINVVKLQCDYLKSSFSEKSTKIWKKPHFFWRYWVKTTVLSKQVAKTILWPSHNVWTLKCLVYKCLCRNYFIQLYQLQYNSLWNLILFFSFRVSEELKGQTDILYGVEAWPLDFQNYLNRNYRKKDQKPMKKAEFESRMVQFLYREHS
jgi:hypothetical protein